VKTGAVVLCAGGGTRFHAPGAGHKLLAPFRGRPLVSWALESAVAAELGPVVAVSGAVALGGAVPAGVVVVHNPEWAQGLATSLQRALALGAELGLDAVVVGLGDQPLVPSSAWRAVAGSPAPVAVATYGDRRGNPVKLARGVWADLPATGDEGGRALMRLRPELV
jgi:molybdenum cofactor cytidylyltransferase